jgi:hypothetical protein
MSSFYIRTAPGGGTCYIPSRTPLTGPTGPSALKGSDGERGTLVAIPIQRTICRFNWTCFKYDIKRTIIK